MQEISEERFTFDLGSLPRGKFLKLSDALSIVFYGGVPSIRYEGKIPLSAVEGGTLCVIAGEWVLDTDRGRILGPRWVDIARPGALWFGIEDSAEPDPTQLADHEQKYLVRLQRYQTWLADQAALTTSASGPKADRSHTPVPRPYGPDAIEPFWQAEMGRRRAAFISRLNAAARSREVRFKGVPAKKPWVLKGSKFQSEPGKISSAYFVEDRGFDEDLCSIDAIGEFGVEPEYDNSSAGRRYVSYRDVVIKRDSFLGFLEAHYPTILSPNRAEEQLRTKEAIQRLAHALHPAMTKAEAADIVGWPVGSRHFDRIWAKARVAAGLQEKAPPGRKKKSAQN